MLYLLKADYMQNQYHIYIMASIRRTLYIGVTSNLLDRVLEHKEDVYPKSFTSRYKVHKLVYYEEFQLIREAIHREKQLKRWNRRKKLDLIDKFNSEWRDLYLELF